MNAARNMFPLSRSATSILIATPNAAVRRRLGDSLRKLTSVEDAGTGAEALSMLERRGARIVVLDRKLPDLNSDELIGVIERQFPYTDVVLLDGESGEIHLPEELRGHAAYALVSGVQLQHGAESRRAARHTRQSRPAQGCRCRAWSAPARPCCNWPRWSALSLPTPPLCSSPGKPAPAKNWWPRPCISSARRADKPFVTVNCAAIPEALVEAELFGHTRGAFTGAVQSRLGKIHAAQGGTIFFDEIGELPLASQAKLLRFLECGEVQRLGTSDVFRLDARVIAATNVDLEKRVQQRLFREDLYYRLSVFPIELPPLRERPADICSAGPALYGAADRQPKGAVSLRRPRPNWLPTPGRATFASCVTLSSAPSFSPAAAR